MDRQRIIEIYRYGGSSQTVAREFNISERQALKLRPSPEEVYVIEKNIPMPPRSTVRSNGMSRRMNFPWHALAVSDSFFVPGLPPCGMSKQLAQAAKKYNHVYRTRAMNGGVRIWRVG